MKKLMIFCLLAICLLGLTAAAKAGKPLYAVEDINGKWGYIDNEGSLVIPFSFSYADDFRGDYALVRQFPDGTNTYEEDGFYGIIDQTGGFILPPEYDILSEDNGGYACGIDHGVFYVRNGWGSGSKSSRRFGTPPGGNPYFSRLPGP